MFAKKTTHLGTAFKQYFEIVPAITEELKMEAYRIRHSVYCEDLEYESIRLNGLETDEYDANALHVLIRNISKNTFIGCARIIIPLTEDPAWLLPFERTCADTLDYSIIDSRKLPRKRIAEISRLAVISSFRRRKGEADCPINLSEDDFKPEPAPRFPYIPIGLYYGAIELARLNQIELLFILTEKRLANHFNKLGFGIEFIGAPVNHRGLRFPSMFNINNTIKNIRPLFQPLYQAVAENIQTGLRETGSESSVHHKIAANN